MNIETKRRIAAAVAKGRVPREDVERHAAGTYFHSELAGFSREDLAAYLAETA